MLDDIDKKILHELGINSRQTYKNIAIKIGSKKDIVAYRLSQMINKEIITKFSPVFSLTTIGIFSYKIYLRLQGLSKELESEIIQRLVKNKKISWVSTAIGRWDLLLGMYAKDILEFSKIKNEILSDLSPYIQDYNITQIEDAIVLNRDHFLEENDPFRKEFVYGGKKALITLTKIDYKIISLIKNNGRFSSTELSKKLNLDSRTILSRIKTMKAKGILQGFTVFIDLNKINHQLHKLCISLKSFSKEALNKIINECKSNPYTIHIIKSLGSWELEIEIETNNTTQVHDYIKNLKNMFPETIKQIELVTITNEKKLDFFPSLD